jgi:hypothetical protein
MRLRDGKREQAVPHQPFHEEGWAYDPHIFRFDKYTPGIFPEKILTREKIL